MRSPTSSRTFAAALATLAALVGCGDAPDAVPGAAAATSSTATGGGSSAGSGGGASVTATTTGGAAQAGGAAPTEWPYPVPDWATGEPGDHGVDASGLDAASAVAEDTGSYCLLVIRHGVLVYERYYGDANASSTPDSWSIAKSYASTLVGIAIDRGDLAGLDTSASEYVPSWKGTDHEPITLGHLVSMTSGLAWSAFDDYVAMATFAQDHTAHALSRPVADPPGTTWTYDNAAVQVLEPVFRGATGDTIEAYAEQHLWSKLGMSASWGHDPSGNPTAYANVLATCRDHARLGYLYLRGGVWAGGETVVSPGWLAGATAPSQPINRAYGRLLWLNGETPAEDAMMQPWPGRMVPFAPTDLFAARGFGNQFIDVIPSLDLVVVRFGPDPMKTFDLVALANDAQFQTHDAILEPLLAAVAP